MLVETWAALTGQVVPRATRSSRLNWQQFPVVQERIGDQLLESATHERQVLRPGLTGPAVQHHPIQRTESVEPQNSQSSATPVVVLRGLQEGRLQPPAKSHCEEPRTCGQWWRALAVPRPCLLLEDVEPPHEVQRQQPKTERAVLDEGPHVFHRQGETGSVARSTRPHGSPDWSERCQHWWSTERVVGSSIPPRTLARPPGHDGRTGPSRRLLPTDCRVSAINTRAWQSTSHRNWAQCWESTPSVPRWQW